MKSYKPLLIGLLAVLATACADHRDPENFAPTVRIVSPVANARVTRGDSRTGAGSFNGSGFEINVEVVTHDSVNVITNESLNIRNTALLGNANPNMPGLMVLFDTDLVKPDGVIIPKNTNLAALFNIAGTDDTPGAGVTIWTGWHVLESIPVGVSQFTITVSVRDKTGKTGTDKITLAVAEGSGIVTSGQALTPPPSATLNTAGPVDPAGPVVTLLAPRDPSSVSTGPKTAPTPPTNASLFFIQVSALDVSRAGIGVNENGEGRETPAGARLSILLSPPKAPTVL